MGYYEEQQAQEKAFRAKARAFAREVRDLAIDAVEGATGVRYGAHDTCYDLRFEVEGLRFQVVFPDYGKLNAASISLRCDSNQRGKIDLHGSPKTRTARAIGAVRKYIAACLAERARFQASVAKRIAKENEERTAFEAVLISRRGKRTGYSDYQVNVAGKDQRVVRFHTSCSLKLDNLTVDQFDKVMLALEAAGLVGDVKTPAYGENEED